ncbi:MULTISPECIES: SRPBCC family protein [Streptomyces]|uniref:SRPBCC family protein n=1 Tax=Streptomyces silvisoli TaxID=3034235 RepID=A0ABT5ZCY4_9ACTN|nr:MULTISPECIES: SRPBCC family protein [Streptomyces]MDF3287683.1 SRPBCC family protein [Streptomyces silvisoli]
MTADHSTLAEVPGLIRVENTTPEQLAEHCARMTRESYPHQQVYGRYCTIEQYVDCPPEQVYDYLRQGHHLEEWTCSLRDFGPTDTPGLWLGRDLLEPGTGIYCKVVANSEAMTVDYHCAWDQGETLWMVYLMRVVPASLVLDEPGSVVTWTNCRHPYYDANPFPERAPRPDRRWVGEYWDLFYAGHTVEMHNLKAILEHRHKAGLPVSVPPTRAVAR